VNFTATDEAGMSSSCTFYLSVLRMTVNVEEQEAPSLLAGYQGSLFDAPLIGDFDNFSQGFYPLEISNNSSLPDGLAFNLQTGSIVGTPTLFGFWNSRIRVCDSEISDRPRIHPSCVSFSIEIRITPYKIVPRWKDDFFHVATVNSPYQLAELDVAVTGVSVCT